MGDLTKGYVVLYRDIVARDAKNGSCMKGDIASAWDPSSIVLFGVHPLIWASRALEVSQGYLWTMVLGWTEFDDSDGSILRAVREQHGFSHEEHGNDETA